LTAERADGCVSLERCCDLRRLCVLLFDDSARQVTASNALHLHSTASKKDEASTL
jgi:hypothetical protein